MTTEVRETGEAFWRDLGAPPEDELWRRLGMAEEILQAAEARGLERAQAHMVAYIGRLRAQLDAARAART